ncbi:MAG: hypothetical protein IJD16_09710 [Desulfovibrio sp.]|nr:hypothetical protein [Desulfovibrio sp.]
MRLLDSAKNIFNSAKDSVLDVSLNTAVKPFLNKAISGYGEIYELKIENKNIKAKGILCGLEDKEIEVVCEHVHISEDGLKLSLYGFKSNMPFAEKALNNFAARDYKITSEVLQKALVLLRKSF